MSLTLPEVLSLLHTRGAQQYGSEAVNQLEHALQCAQLAQQAGEAPATVVAALLHDLGHLLVPAGDVAAKDQSDNDDLHQFRALPFLRALFTDAVLEPIRLHVDAKRYLCQAEPEYWASLSAASKRSLELQGGRFDERQARSFLEQPCAAEAIRLRRYDDQAKEPGKKVPDLDQYRRLLEQVCR